MNAISGSILVFALWGTLTSLAGAQPVTINLVPVGNPGNVADPLTGYGSVPYLYDMGEYDITLSQYTAFLNAVAASGDPYGLYSSAMATNLPLAGITQASSSGTLSYRVKGNGNYPVFDVSWGDSVRFVNWLANGEPTGAEGPGTTETGTYTLNGGTSNAALMAVTRNAGSNWVLPNRNEWYKAAYYQGDSTDAGYWIYPTQSDETPSNLLSATGTNNANCVDATTGVGTNPPYLLTVVGAFAASPGPYGTFDQGGDLWQWDETAVGSSYRETRGGSWADISVALDSSTPNDVPPSSTNESIGFRVAYVPASVPEPSTGAMLIAAATATVLFFKSQRSRNKSEE